MATVSSQDMYRQDPGDIRRKQESALQQGISAGTKPPIVEMSSISLEEFGVYRNKLDHVSISDIREDPLKTTADELQYFAATFGHSRALTFEELVDVCRSSFQNSYRVPAEQWIALKTTTFPFSLLSEAEREAIESNITRIIDRALSLGLYVISIYVAIRLLKRLEERSPTVIIQSGGGDIAIDSTIDKRSGGTYIDSLEYIGSKVISPDKIAAYEVLFEQPPQGYYKLITVVLIPQSEKYFAFPNHLQYLSNSSLPQFRLNFARSNTESEVCRTAHLLGILGIAAQTATDQLAGLLQLPSAMTRSVIADVLGDIPTDKSVEHLVARLTTEPSNRVQEIMVLSLLRVGSRKAIEEVYKYLACHSMGYMTLKLAAQHVDTYLVEVMLESATQCLSEKGMRSLVGFLSQVDHSIVIPVLLQEFQRNDDENVRVFIAELLGELNKEYHVTEIHQAICSQLVAASQEPSEKVALTAAQTLCKAVYYYEEVVERLSEALHSPHVSVRHELAHYLKERRYKDSQDVLKKLYSTETDPYFKEELAKWLESYRKVRRVKIFKTLSEMLHNSLGYVLLIELTVLALISGMAVDLMIRSKNIGLGCLGLLVLSALPFLIAYSLAMGLDEWEPIRRKLALGAAMAIVGTSLLAAALWYQTESSLVKVKDGFEGLIENRWILVTNDRATTTLAGGKLVITVKDPNVMGWSKLAGYHFTDFEMSVVCFPEKEPKDKLYGVVFRVAGNDDDLYFFAISGEGYYWLLRQRGSQWIPLIRQTPSEHIREDRNTVRVRVEGQRIRAYINRRKLVDIVEQMAPTSGTVGLAVGAYDATDVQVAFDDFSLTILDNH